MRWIRIERCMLCGKFMGIEFGKKWGSTMCGDCWDDCKRREDEVRKDMKKHPCDDCVHYEKSWGACSLEPFIIYDNLDIPDLPKWKPKYNGKECPKFVKKKVSGK